MFIYVLYAAKTSTNKMTSFIKKLDVKKWYEFLYFKQLSFLYNLLNLKKFPFFLEYNYLYKEYINGIIQEQRMVNRK